MIRFIVAFGGMAGAFKLFQAKFSRVRSIREMTGKLTLSFRLFYQVPQYVLLSVLLGLALIMLLALLHPVASEVLYWLPESWMGMNAVIVAFLLSFTIAAVSQWNLFSRLLLWLARWITKGSFGPRGNDLGWLQAKCAVEGPDDGAPLSIGATAVDRIALTILSALTRRAESPDLAASPTDEQLALDKWKPSYSSLEDGEIARATRANIALFGCIVEANPQSHDWGSLGWAKFYSALARMQQELGLFTPNLLLAYENGGAFFNVFREQLDKAFDEAEGPPNKSLAAAEDVSRAWSVLSKHGGRLFERDIRRRRHLSHKRWRACEGALRKFPRMDVDGALPQCIKLLIRWKAITYKGTFMQPIARPMTWMLLEEEAILVPSETSHLSFNGTSQLGIAKLAAGRVVERVLQLINAGDSSEARAVRDSIGDDEWVRAAWVDFVLWSTANAEYKLAKEKDWEGRRWRRCGETGFKVNA